MRPKTLKRRIVQQELGLTRFCGWRSDTISAFINEALQELERSGCPFFEMQNVILKGPTRIAWVLEGLPHDEDPPETLLNYSYLTLLRIVNTICHGQ